MIALKYAVACTLIFFTIILLLFPDVQSAKIFRIKQRKGKKSPRVQPKAKRTAVDNTTLLIPPWKVCPSGQEGAQIPIQTSAVKDVISIPPDFNKNTYTTICVEPYGSSCTYPGSFVAFSDSCSLQCQCINAQKTLNIISSDFHYSNCRSVCSTPPTGLRCFARKETGTCCPTYTDCVNSPFDGQWTKDSAAFISSKFRCQTGETLDSATCLMLVLEAMPVQEFTPTFRAKCQCVAEDTYKISLTPSTVMPQPNAGKTKFALIREGGQTRNQRL